MDFFRFRKTCNGLLVLDFEGCRYWSDVHRVLKETFDFPDFYGENWDALWDLLRDALFELDITVELHHLHTLPAPLLEYCAPMLEVFADVHKLYPRVVFVEVS